MDESDAEGLLDRLDVSRETEGRLREFLHLVERWNPRINLVSRPTIAQAWRRHILDSAQLWLHADRKSGLWLDIGSGGGMPGVVIAVLAHELAPDLKVTMVEADQRKCVFLREALRHLGVSATIRSERIEALAPLRAEVLSARALTDLDRLLGYTYRHLLTEGLALFPKGKAVLPEIDAARRNWSFDVAAVPSVTDAEGVILKIRNVRHA